MATSDEADILDAAGGALAELGIQLDHRPPAASAHYDADLVLTLDQQTRQFRAEVKRRMSVAQVGQVRQQILQTIGPDGVLVLPHVTPALADRLRELDQQFLDAAGNIWLQAPGWRLWQVGRRPAETLTQAPEPRTGGAAVQIQFALLANPDLADAPLRAIAEVSHTSLGSVQATMRLLDQRGHFIRRDDQRVLVERARLLETWTPLYLQVLRPRLLLGRFLGAAGDWWRSATLPDAVEWGGETAGALLTNQLRPQIATVYADELPRALLVGQRLRKAQPRESDEATLEVRRRFWQWRALETPIEGVVPPLLAYADLLAGDARCVEIAGRIRSEYLAAVLDRG